MQGETLVSNTTNFQEQLSPQRWAAALPLLPQGPAGAAWSAPCRHSRTAAAVGWAGVAGVHLCPHSAAARTPGARRVSRAGCPEGPRSAIPAVSQQATFACVPVATYVHSAQPFRLGERSLSPQYAHMYATHLIQVRPFLASRAQQQWGKWPVWGSAPARQPRRHLGCFKMSERPGRTGTFHLSRFPTTLGRLTSLSLSLLFRLRGLN